MNQTQDIVGIVAENRQAFMRYTIARLRELLRNLPQNRLDLFHILPFLLHVNNPSFPGYVESGLSFYGIFRFERSGFFKSAARIFRLAEPDLKALLPGKHPILGLYLMGSAGTLTQTGRSDFDFWVIVRADQLGSERLTLLERKLKIIEHWCRSEHNQDVTFFVMDIEKLRKNQFSSVDGESSGSAQQTLLKDEFYRTFIMIAGRIPLWAVLPPDLPADDTSAFVAAMADGGVPMEDYIDTGNLTGIDPRECLGALLWQVYKARKDPVKSLIKSSLAAAYAFMGDDGSGLVSAQVRRRFATARIDDYEDDPYTLVFETIMEFYRDMNDNDGLELIRQCIFLRLWSYPLMIEPEEGSPKGRMLKRFLLRWKPDPETLTLLTGLQTLSEKDHIAFEDRIFDKLSFLYELVLRSADDDQVKFFMTKEDITALKNRTSAFLRRKIGKIPRCSVFLKSRADSGMKFGVTRVEEGREDGGFLGLYDESQETAVPIHTCRGFMGLTGFLLANGLDVKNLSHPMKSINDTAVFFDGVLPRPDSCYGQPAEAVRTIVLLTAPSRNGDLENVEVLSCNSWGEFFYAVLNVAAIESPEAKCYKITEFIAPFRFGMSVPTIEYRVSPPDALGHYPYVFSLKSMAGKADIPVESVDVETSEPVFEKKGSVAPKAKPFLDLI